jgi:single-strand DNA-binding protein
MASLNKVFLLGNLTKDPEIRFTPQGKPVGDLRMAVSRRFKGANGEDREETCFVNVVVWGPQAQSCGDYLRKGSPVLVDGRLQYEEWEKDGKKNSRLRVVAERVQFMGGPKSGAEFRDGPRPASAPDAAPSSGGEGEPPPGAAGDEDNLPF